MTISQNRDPAGNNPPDFRFSPSQRLLTATQFKKVFDQPSLKVGARHFLLLISPNEQSIPRLGLVVAKKRSKRAVDRNTIKRIIRESFRLRQHHLPAADIVVLLRHNLRNPDAATLRAELEGLWDKLLAKWNQA